MTVKSQKNLFFLKLFSNREAESKVDAEELVFRVLLNAFIIREIPIIESSHIDDSLTRPKSSQVSMQYKMLYYSQLSKFGFLKFFLKIGETIHEDGPENTKERATNRAIQFSEVHPILEATDNPNYVREKSSYVSVKL